MLVHIWYFPSMYSTTSTSLLPRPSCKRLFAALAPGLKRSWWGEPEAEEGDVHQRFSMGFLCVLYWFSMGFLWVSMDFLCPEYKNHLYKIESFLPPVQGIFLVLEAPKRAFELKEASSGKMKKIEEAYGKVAQNRPKQVLLWKFWPGPSGFGVVSFSTPFRLPTSSQGQSPVFSFLSFIFFSSNSPTSCSLSHAISSKKLKNIADTTNATHQIFSKQMAFDIWSQSQPKMFQSLADWCHFASVREPQSWLAFWSPA